MLKHNQEQDRHKIHNGIRPIYHLKMRQLLLRLTFPFACIILQSDSSACVSLPPTAFTLPDVLSAKDTDSHDNGMVVNHGI